VLPSAPESTAIATACELTAPLSLSTFSLICAVDDADAAAVVAAAAAAAAVAVAVAVAVAMPATVADIVGAGVVAAAFDRLRAEDAEDAIDDDDEDNEEDDEFNDGGGMPPLDAAAAARM